MEYRDNILCISHAELTDGIMTSDNLRKQIERGKVVRIQRACYETPALYSVESLPTKYRQEVKKRYGDPEAQARARRLIDMVEIDQGAAAYYESVVIDGSRGLSAEKRMKYTNSASILNAIKRMLEEARSEQTKVGKRNRVNLQAFWKARGETMSRIADVYPHSLPENPRSLQRKYLDYWKGGMPNYGALVSGKFKNGNAAKVATEEQKAVLVKFIGHHTNLDCQEVADYYNTIGESLGWDKITSRTVWNWAEKYGWAVDAGRRGAKDYLNRMAMQVKRSGPTAPMLFWSLDGWVVELYYKKRSEGKRGGRTTYCNRLVTVVVLDPYNNYPIGYATGYQESPELIKEALKNAADQTRELFGERLRPNQIQSDNYQIKTMLPTYGIAAYVTPAAVGNAKAKPIEPYFHRLNHKYAKKCVGNWSGYGITSRKESQPNLEWLNAHKGEIPEEGGVRAQIDWIIESERTQKRAEYVAGLTKLPTERRLAMSEETYLLHFGAETGYKNALEGTGLNIRLLGERRTYDSFDIEFRKYAHVRWNVKYDPTDLSRVLAVSDEGDLRFMLEAKHEQPMALADRRAGDAEELERVREFNRELKRTVIDFDERATEIVRESILRHPDIDNPYAKSLITDSRGQHKDRNSEYRLEYTGAAEEASYEELEGARGSVDTRDLY